MNGRITNINSPLEPNSDIIIEPSTAGPAAVCTLEQLEEYSADTVSFVVNGSIIRCPKFLEVNGKLEMPSYEIQPGDEIETRSFYTVGQLVTFMDVEVSKEHVILVNNREANFDTLIYENFTIEWTVISYKSSAYMPQNLTPAEEELPEATENRAGSAEVTETATTEAAGAETAEKMAAGTEAASTEATENAATETVATEEASAETPAEAAGTEASGIEASGTDAAVPDAAEQETSASSDETAEANLLEQEPGTIGILVYINGEPVRLSGKSHYIFVDIFDFYPFDLKASNGRSIITNLNGQNAQYSAELKAGDQIELAWK